MTALRRGDVVAGLVYLLVLALLLAGVAAAYGKTFERTVAVTLTASTAGNAMRAGADVKMRGVLVGRVTGISASATGAVLDLALDPAQTGEVPADVQARLLPKTLLGERYVSLVVPGGGAASGPMIAAGATIHEDRSAEAVELQRVLDDLLPLLQTVQPEKLASTLGEVSGALRGRGRDLGSSLSELGAYVQRLQPRVPRIADDLQALSSVADTYTQAAPDLLAALDDLTTFAQTQVDQQQQLASLYATVVSSANTTGGWVGDNSSTIIALSRDSLPALDTTARYASEFPCTLAALTALVGPMDRALGKGTDQPGVHGTLSIVPSRGRYVSGRDAVVPTAAGGPRCPYVPTGRSVVAPDGTTQAYAAPAASGTGAGVALPSAAAGLGLANSPAENAWIAELVAPDAGTSPQAFPGFSSLLLGPALRGSVVTRR
ncbi:MCE family protein [Lapillicoccus jejuensis]|uniref:Phospholipid/cholesterol/gamma-HCH transport system substrate-binding protein n=1 Tax=Lapillicoccus jejuensis TaxID=402171 RepID=A0A542DWG7_9MICO|nr:MCE family protein [Lapillicoccus jejuensis]TQJ07437.1 phospholipid/cholesterol/gamma-HCH transport system substrate-binding protein [Lapillicoccus jejuensis]